MPPLQSCAFIEDLQTQNANAAGGDAGGVRLAEAEAFAASPLPSDDELPPPPSEAEHRAEQNVAT
eukprot:1153130-Pelagomonas_calceolata.AAC.3